MMGGVGVLVCLVLVRLVGGELCHSLGLVPGRGFGGRVTCGSEQESWVVSRMGNNQVLLTTLLDEQQHQICLKRPDPQFNVDDVGQRRGLWRCKYVIFIVQKHGGDQRRTRLPRQATEDVVLPPVVAKKDVKFSIIEVAGGEWVCEQLTETQCKPLYPKKSPTDNEGPRLRSLTSQQQTSQELGGLDSSVRSSVSGIVNDDNRWRWTGGAGTNVQSKQVEEGEGTQDQYVYNINGITWLCRQFKQLQCYPVFSPLDGQGQQPPSPSPQYPEYPGQESPLTTPASTTRRAVASRRVDTGTSQPTPSSRIYEPLVRPPHKRTSFCAREIRFTAKDEVVLRFNTYSGNMDLYLRALRVGQNQVELKVRMLRPGETGLVAKENSPPVLLRARVNCDRIMLELEEDGQTRQFRLDYDFGRQGVRDLEVVGNLESTGMVPRAYGSGGSTGGRRGGVANFVSKEDFQEIQLQPSPDQGLARDDSDNITEEEDTEEEEEEEPDSVSEDNFQIDGTGDVELSLDEKGQDRQHRYQISRGQDGQVNVEVLVEEDDTKSGQKTLVIDNTDYNYTLVVTGQDFQIIHHDTKKNLTYRHGLDEQAISGVGVRGEIQGTSTSFKEKPELVGTARLFPNKKDLQGVSIFGNLCIGPCTVTSDSSHYCQVSGGTTEQCGPDPNMTPYGENCADECRKRDDSYFWCQRKGKPWDYCSPPLVFQQKLTCPPESERQMTPDPTDCARYLTCEAGRVKLEECPDGLHYIHRNRTCEWPTGGECSNPFGRFGNGPNSVLSVGDSQPILTPGVTKMTPVSSSSTSQTTSAGTPSSGEKRSSEAQTTEKLKITTDNLEEDGLATLNDLLTFLNENIEEDSFVEPLNPYTNNLVRGRTNPTTSEIVLVREDQLPSTQLNNLEETTNYQSLQDLSVEAGELRQGVRQTFGDANRLLATSELASTTLDQDLSFGTFEEEGGSFREEDSQELLSTAEGGIQPTVWGHSTTQRSFPVVFTTGDTTVTQGEKVEGRTLRNRNNVRFPSGPATDSELFTIPLSYQTETSPSTGVNNRGPVRSSENVQGTRRLIFPTSSRTPVDNSNRNPVVDVTSNRTPDITSNLTPAVENNLPLDISKNRTPASSDRAELSVTDDQENPTNRSNLPRRLWQEGGDGNSLQVDSDQGKTTSNNQGTKSPVSSTVQTSTGKEEDDSADILAKALQFKGTLTSHGELCTDGCEKRGYPYYWCHKKSSSLGQWWDSDFCSPSSSVTHYGKECANSCSQRGEVYFWCNRQVDGGWGYCSPNTIYKEGICENNDGYYAIVGDCERYISCRGGKPIPFSCEKSLFFDFILQSCTFEKDARCIGGAPGG